MPLQVSAGYSSAFEKMSGTAMFRCLYTKLPCTLADRRYAHGLYEESRGSGRLQVCPPLMHLWVSEGRMYMRGGVF